MNRFIILLFILPLLVPGQSTIGPGKAALTTIYSQAIADYIKAVNKKHKTTFDTLFFGKHLYGQSDDFPDIELPETIENTHIRLITPEAGLIKQKEHESGVYINMVGWVGKEKAEFIFVTFSNGFEHQYDCFIDYKYDLRQKKFLLSKKRFEYFLYQGNIKAGGQKTEDGRRKK
jgi:hypothetical protein